MSKHPEALRIADWLSGVSWRERAEQIYAPTDSEIADELRSMHAELRRLHSLNAELLEALKAICDEQDANEGYAAPATYDAARAAIAKAEAQQ